MPLEISWSAASSGLPFQLAVVSIFYLLMTFDLLAAVMVLLIAVNVAVTWALKRIVRGKRPDGADHGTCANLGSGVSVANGDAWGMPSGHTQLAFSFFAFAAFVVLWRFYPSAGRGDWSWRQHAFLLVSLPIFVLLPLMVAYQRCRSRCHSPAQVCVGAAIGLLLAGLAALFMKQLRRDPIGQSCSGKVARW